jgi:hypothetical protein
MGLVVSGSWILRAPWPLAAWKAQMSGEIGAAGLKFKTPSLPGLFWGVPGGGRGVCGGVRSANQLKVTR